MVGHILIVCVGNICRSPMAEALLAHEMGDRVAVESAGLGALVGESADEAAQLLLRELEIDISNHRARELTPELVRKADLILVMESVHRQAMHSRFPGSRGKVFRLGEWGKFDIDDPHGQSVEVFRQTLEGVRRGVSDWTTKLERLAKE